MKSLNNAILLLTITLLVSCNNKQATNDKKENVKSNIENTIDRCDSIKRSSSSTDSTISENEYGRLMEHAMCEKAKLLRNLSNEEKLLIEYELAKKTLLSISKKANDDHSLYQNAQFIEDANKKMNCVRDFYSKLQNSKLTSDQQERFRQITKMGLN